VRSTHSRAPAIPPYSSMSTPLRAPGDGEDARGGEGGAGGS
jgi:hypothetical protein